MSESITPRPALRIAQLNCGKNFFMMQNIREIKKQGIDVLCVSEPYIGDKSKINIAGTILFIDPNVSDPKAAIYLLNKSIGCSFIHANKHDVAIKLISHDITIFSHYIPPKQTADNDQLVEKLCSRLNSSSRKTIHLGDFNGRSKDLLDDNFTNVRGTKIVSRCVKNGWTILNTPAVPTFTGLSKQGLSKSSIVDLSICSPDLVHRASWYLGDETTLRELDHKLIITEVQVDSMTKEEPKYTYKSRKFIKEMKKRMGMDSDDWYNNLMSALEASKSVIEPKHYEWKMSDKLKLMRSKLDDLARFCKRRKLPPNSIERDSLRLMNKNYKKAIKHERLEAFDLFISQLTENEAFRSCWKLIRRGNDSTVSCISINNRPTYDFETIANHALQNFYPDTDDESHEYKHLVSPVANDPPFTANEVNRVISSFGNRKAPGTDRMNTKMIKEWNTADPHTILNIANQMLQTETFPEQYKTFRIILLKKRPLPIPLIDQCRPIGLGCILGKVLEKLLINRIYYHAVSNSYLTEAQHGFVDGKSCVTALTEIQQELDRPSTHKLLFSIDIKGAFNNVKHSAIIKSMIKANIPSNLVNTWKDYLTNRTVQMIENGISVTRKMVKGCVQGSPGGPLNYILATNDIIREIQQEVNSELLGCKLVVFADDCSGILSTSCSDPLLAKNILMRNASTVIKKFQDKLTQVGLEVSPAKTQLMLISKDYTPTFINHYGTPLLTSKTCKILGVIFSHNGSFHDHLMNRLSKARSSLTALTKYCRLKYGLCNTIRISIVDKAITPMISYASSIWFSKLNQKSRNEIKKFNRWVTIVITGSYKSISYASTLILGRYKPIHHEVEKRSRIERQKTLGISFKYKVSILKKAQIKDAPHPARKTPIDILARISGPDDIGQIEGYDMYIYTDGSRPASSTKNAGAALVVLKSNLDKPMGIKMFKLDTYTTSFYAELIALDQAVTFASTYSDKYSRLCICTDSLSSLTAFNNPHTKNRIILSIQRRVALLLEKGKTVDFVHVSAHVGIHGNELADKYANLACSHGRPTATLAEEQVINRDEESRMAININKEYRSTIWGRTIKKFFESPNDPWCRFMLINRYTVQLYSGHGIIRSYLFERKKASSNKCPCDPRIIQDVEHILFHCPLFNDIKKKYRKDVKIPMQIRLENWTELNKLPDWHRYLSLMAHDISHNLRLIHNYYEHYEGSDDYVLDRCFYND